MNDVISCGLPTMVLLFIVHDIISVPHTFTKLGILTSSRHAHPVCSHCAIRVVRPGWIFFSLPPLLLYTTWVLCYTQIRENPAHWDCVGYGSGWNEIIFVLSFILFFKFLKSHNRIMYNSFRNIVLSVNNNSNRNTCTEEELSDTRYMLWDVHLW